MSPAAPLLRARGVTRRFGGLTAVADVSLDLAEGEIHAVIGTNGAGKSTLINVLPGEIAITDGTVELLGHDVTHVVATAARAGGTWPQLSAHDDFSALLGVRELPPRRAGDAPGPVELVDAGEPRAR